MKTLKTVSRGISDSGAWKKLAKPTISRGKTAWPKNKPDLEQYDVRFDYDGEVVQNGQVFHKYQSQPYAGKIPASTEDCRNMNGGTRGVMTSILIKQDATQEEVTQAVDNVSEG
ncbi:hypothetical protein BU25DRAFT_420152 [Macroventuria anomochaeta]|uniref:Uncharacterized protein n=1 Tax=Macroventuria anomochaeta TaxID=301207 RepID=A0ACB6S5P1_9PLEO|nr:uncharacterized protein BU25DRAFT_420152 [Macroventuria anomochaeta]KAF2629278.1 hypothetical protein BU25DRAFT_420152 [Macroventuria anomochaeta]